VIQESLGSGHSATRVRLHPALPVDAESGDLPMTTGLDGVSGAAVGASGTGSGADGGGCGATGGGLAGGAGAQPGPVGQSHRNPPPSTLGGRTMGLSVSIGTSMSSRDGKRDGSQPGKWNKHNVSRIRHNDSKRT
jgi:hypothetical protein